MIESTMTIDEWRKLVEKKQNELAVLMLWRRKHAEAEACELTAHIEVDECDLDYGGNYLLKSVLTKEV